MLVDERTHDLGPLRTYLDRQRRLGHVELTGPGGTSTLVELREPLDTGNDILRAAKDASIDLRRNLRSIQVRPHAARPAAPELRRCGESTGICHDRSRQLRAHRVQGADPCPLPLRVVLVLPAVASAILAPRSPGSTRPVRQAG
jgi:hypothetical protein